MSIVLLKILQSGIYALIVFIMLILIKKGISRLNNKLKFIQERIRKLNIIKALEEYWKDNLELIDDEMKFRSITVKEFSTMNRLCEQQIINETEFRKALSESEIKYCYEYYLKICNTAWAKDQIKKAIKDKYKQ